LVAQESPAHARRRHLDEVPWAPLKRASALKMPD
jgi:hypothetical protein